MVRQLGHVDWRRIYPRLSIPVVAAVAGSVAAGPLTVVNPFLPIGVASSLLAFTWGLFRPRSALILMLCLLPFGAFLKRVQYLFLPPNEVWAANNPVTFVPEAIFYSLMFGTIVVAMRVRPWRFTTGIIRWLDASVATFLIIAILGSIRPGLSPIAGLLGFRSGYVFVATYFVAATFIGRSRVPYRTVVLAIVLPAIVVAVYGIKQYALGLFPFEEAWVASGGDGLGQLQVTFLGNVRTFSTLGSPAGYYLLIPFLVALSATLWRARGFSILWMGSAAILIGIGIVLSTAKSAIVLMMIGTLVGVGLASTRAVWSVPVVLAAVSVALTKFGPGLAEILAGQLPDVALSETIRFAADPTNAPTLVSRLDQMREAMGVAAHNPLGLGLASTGGLIVFGEAVQATIADNTLETYYGRIAVEMGVLGSLAMFVVLGLCILVALMMFTKARRGQSPWVAASFLLVAIAGAISGVGWEVLGIKESAVLFWFVMGWMRSEWARTMALEV